MHDHPRRKHQRRRLRGDCRRRFHHSTLGDGDAGIFAELTGGRVSAEVLIERSFEFLLERESNTSILSTFDLPVIQRYFSEYERTIASALRQP